MVAALLVRRAQYLERGLEDPFPAAGSGFATVGLRLMLANIC